jgi:hypothetical protein
MSTTTRTTERDQQKCEHWDLAFMLGFGIGNFWRCRDCGMEFIRVSTGPAPEDWEYQELQRGDEA